MRKYYKLHLSPDPTVIGVSNGTTQVRFDKSCFDNINAYEKVMSYFDIDNYYSLSKQVKFREIAIEIPHLNILNRAKITDVMGFGPYLPDVKYLVSLRLRELLTKFNIQEHKFFRTELWDKKRTIENYFFLYMIPLENTEIVFSKSKMRDSSTVYDLKEESDYDYYSAHGIFNFSKICLKKKHINLDFLSLDISPFWYVSAELKSAMQEEDITGLDFYDADIIFE